MLTQGSVDPNLLASTPDANTTDPFIQQEAAVLDYNAQNIFNFLHNDVGYNSYTGSLRGARGTLWSDAGNALDVASLGVALMRASGIPGQYVQGTLSQSQAQQLILSMFPASYQTVGYIPSGTQTSDPADDSQLLSETESHYWFEFNTGNGWVNADPLMPGAEIGQTFTAATGSFTEVPDSLRQTTEVSLTAEIYSQAAAAFGIGGDGLSDTVVLDQTFNDVDLVGRPLTIGNLVSSSSSGALFLTTTTNTYTPYIVVGDDALPDSQLPDAIVGQQYQEFLTNFPLASQVLTGLFLNITLSGPGTTSETFSRALVDRIGYAARQGLGSPNISVSPGSAPAFTNYDAFTLDVSAGADDPHPAAETGLEMQADAAQLASAAQQSQDVAAASASFARGFDFDMTRKLGNNFLTLSQLYTNVLATSAGVAAYYAQPRIVLISTRLAAGSGTTASSLTTAIDILNDSLRVEAAPGQASATTYTFNLTRGVFENLAERDTVAALSPSDQTATVDDTYDVFTAAAAQGIGLVAITSANLYELQGLNIPADAKARIATDVGDGFGVIVPDQTVMLGGTPPIAWADINPATGEYIGVDSNGGHQGLVEYLDLVSEDFELAASVTEFFSPVAGFDAGAILSQRQLRTEQPDGRQGVGEGSSY